MPKPKPKSQPAGSQSKTEPQKRGEVFDTLLSFFRKPKRKTLTLELPRALKSYPYIAMKRAGVKAKAEYETVSKAKNPLDDVLRFKITLPKEQGKTPDKKPNEVRQRGNAVKTTSNVVPITPTKGVDITQVAEVTNA